VFKRVQSFSLGKRKKVLGIDIGCGLHSQCELCNTAMWSNEVVKMGDFMLCVLK
jgi:hypothetical protein